MLDMMKRQQSNVDWPHCGPMLITLENKIFCACESIVLSEGTIHFSLIMNYVYEIHGADRYFARIIFGDGTHSNNLSKTLNVEKNFI